jgi:nitroimidazol reductase NimA-like FMN-containing flavoprotein (pyridoxamine 5'-phosphate oxidase superfamily)
MKRKVRGISDQDEIGAIPDDALVCRGGLADGGNPYVVPLCFGYGDGAISIHAAPEGKKIAMLEQNIRCSFEVDICDQIIRNNRPCSRGCGTAA